MPVSSCATSRSSLLCVVIALLALVGACSSTPTRPATYTVKRGDTLYSIAWRHRLQYQDIARWNGIGRNYVIYPGQRLRLYPSTQSARAPAASQSGPRASAKAHSPPQPPKRAAAPGPPMRWQWPANGGKATLSSRPNGGYGLTIDGRLGDEVRAAADGRVVYTGSGLLGYGQLVIVKHNDTYLSAYGHTQAVAVKEGHNVRAGQRIATMGSGPRGEPSLYFEIRVNGTPDNPLRFLPRQ